MGFSGKRREGQLKLVEGDAKVQDAGEGCLLEGESVSRFLVIP
jgi:hypothetical protein